MRALTIGVAMLLALAAAAASPAVAEPEQSFDFSCEIDLNQLVPADLQRVVPENQRTQVYLTTGTKKCTFSANGNTDIKCERRVTNWANPTNVTIKRFNQPCQWFLEDNQCDASELIIAKSQQFKIKRIDATTASLELSCSGKRP